MKNYQYKCLDLFCGAGGAGEGYARAGFEVTGIDINPQPNNPHTFIQSDAIEYLLQSGHLYDFIHASPPCQKYSKATKQFRLKGYEYADLMEITRNALIRVGKPYIIENVPGAPMRKDLILRGDMFRLKVLRRRWFECSDNLLILQPSIKDKIGSVREGDYCSVFGKGSYCKSSLDALPKFKIDSVVSTWKMAMGIDWMKKEKELAQAIPPAYTEYIGKEVIKHLDNAKSGDISTSAKFYSV